MFEVNDKVKIIGKSLGRKFSTLEYSEGIITSFRGSGDGSDSFNCIVVKPFDCMDSDWYAPRDLILPLEKQIEQMFDELIKDL